MGCRIYWWDGSYTEHDIDGPFSAYRAVANDIYKGSRRRRAKRVRRQKIRNIVRHGVIMWDGNLDNPVYNMDEIVEKMSREGHEINMDVNWKLPEVFIK